MQEPVKERYIIGKSTNEAIESQLVQLNRRIKNCQASLTQASRSIEEYRAQAERWLSASFDESEESLVGISFDIIKDTHHQTSHPLIIYNIYASRLAQEFARHRQLAKEAQGIQNHEASAILALAAQATKAMQELAAGLAGGLHPLPPVTIKLEGEITTISLEIASLLTENVDISQCRSREWEMIGRRLAALPILRDVKAERCILKQDFCRAISESQSILSLHIRKGSLT